MRGRFAFPRQLRVLRERDFRRILRRGRRVRCFPLRVYVLPRGQGASRLGLAVSRKAGGAVVRNRWKRAIREAFRLNRHRLRVPHDFVVSVDWQSTPDDVRAAARALCGIIDELNAAEAQGGDDGDS